jgi:mannose-binding lectin 2
VNKKVGLTQAKASENGHAWSNQLLTAASWVIEVDFKVYSDNHNGLFGDGFAFWVTKEKEVIGPVFGSKDKFNGLGVFFDTYANGRHRVLIARS